MCTFESTCHHVLIALGSPHFGFRPVKKQAGKQSCFKYMCMSLITEYITISAKIIDKIGKCEHLLYLYKLKKLICFAFI